jgi:putative lipoprotein (rSAM/lipoprotein system)
MKICYLKLKHWLLISVMGALGLTSCHCHKKLADPKTDESDTPVDVRDGERDRGEMKLMYGVPTMNYMIRGQVKDAAGRPVRDIRVNMLERNMEASADGIEGDPEAVKDWLQNTEVRTDDEGRFTIQNSGLPQEEVRLMVRDIDGKENGEYQNQLIGLSVKPEDMDRTNAGGWNQGTFNKQVDIKLEKK